MSEPLRVGTDSLRGIVPGLENLADEVSRAISELKALIAEERLCWGADDIGRTFQEGYLPDAQHAVESLDVVAEVLQAIPPRVAEVADAFHHEDHAGAFRIQAVDSTGGNALGGTDFGTDERMNAVSLAGLNGLGGQKSAPDHAVAKPLRDDVGSVAAPTGSAESKKPHSFDAQDRHRSAPDSVDADRMDADRMDADGPVSEDVVGAGQGPSGRNFFAGDAKAGGGDRVVTPVAKTAADRHLAVGAAPDGVGRDRSSPWSRYSPTPWSSPPRSPAPEGGTPPRVSPPRELRRRGEPVRSPFSPRTTAPRRSPPVPSRSIPDPCTDPAALQIAVAMAARHRLWINGFETALVSVHTVGEIAAAVDDMLSKYTVPLRGIAVTDLAEGAPSGLVWEHSASESRTTDSPTVRPAAWIVLDRTLAADPVAHAEAVRAAIRSGMKVRKCIERVMYSTVVGEFGRLLDGAGGFRAGRHTQRVLIGEYLRVNGADAAAAGGVISGYRRWRSALPGAVVEGVFDPHSALSEAFTEVELEGQDASGPAKGLHQLLVSAATTG
ncbi:hypothetical protein AB0B25_22640 [Nocardia sp. NPDC049190]|uniref:hypothetical protein n=1 Tax=Nocardia sp. NPDC049190 TaxID=3155650 RepID=UPI00340DD381